MPITAQQEPEILKLTIGHVLAAMGFLVALTSSLVAYLWNLLVERLKVNEHRLDVGAEAFTDIKIQHQVLKTTVNTFESNHEVREKLSDHYRESALKKLENLTERVAIVETRIENHKRERVGDVNDRN